MLYKGTGNAPGKEERHSCGVTYFSRLACSRAVDKPCIDMHVQKFKPTSNPASLTRLRSSPVQSMLCMQNKARHKAA